MGPEEIRATRATLRKYALVGTGLSFPVEITNPRAKHRARNVADNALYALLIIEMRRRKTDGFFRGMR